MKPTKLAKRKRIGVWGRLLSLYLVAILAHQVVVAIRRTWTVEGWHLYVALGWLAVVVATVLAELWVAVTGIE